MRFRVQDFLAPPQEGWTDYPHAEFLGSIFNSVNRPGVELRANLKTISHKCHLEEVAFVWELTKETIHLPVSCLQGGLGERKGLISPD